MLAFTNAREKKSPTIIGAGCRLTGDIKTDHSVQIHGVVFGSVYADTLVVGRGGKVVGKVVAKNFFLHGAMEGPATVGIANIFANAQMTGTLSYHTINITGNMGLECRLAKRPEVKK
ncbi:MAG: polymer-forming cytoskeletal protein [Rickettsiales bacterium]|jgi:cytoskeletal protein CcmA (bactofilin family)|nr:polymer-forming cytoskeletal protein [Rickettsiales bacterium]